MEELSASSILREVGRVKDAHGLKGELFVRLYAGRADWLNRFTEGYLTSPDESEIQKFTVEKAHPHKDGLILALGLSDRTPAETLKGYKLQIPAELLISNEGEDIYLDEIVGFEVFDLNSQKKSQVVGISSNGFQDLLEVEYEGQVYMIPFVKPLIEKIDFSKKEIRMRVPVGLLGEIVPGFKK